MVRWLWVLVLVFCAGCSWQYTPEQQVEVDKWRAEAKTAAAELAEAKELMEAKWAEVKKWEARLADGKWRDLSLAEIQEGVAFARQSYNEAVVKVAQLEGRYKSAAESFKAAKEAGVPTWRLVLEGVAVVLLGLFGGKRNLPALIGAGADKVAKKLNGG